MQYLYTTISNDILILQLWEHFLLCLKYHKFALCLPSLVQELYILIFLSDLQYDMLQLMFPLERHTLPCTGKYGASVSIRSFDSGVCSTTSCWYVLLCTWGFGTSLVILFVNPNFKFVKYSVHIIISLTVPVKQCKCILWLCTKYCLVMSKVLCCISLQWITTGFWHFIPNCSCLIKQSSWKGILSVFVTSRPHSPTATIFSYDIIARTTFISLSKVVGMNRMNTYCSIYLRIL